MEIKRVLVANRGVIAKRVIATLRRMGIESVAIFHEDEKTSDYLSGATYCCSLGNGDLQSTFLNISKIMGVAEEYSCSAIHPGYGFLSENYMFAKTCEGKGIKFIGPESSVIRSMGLKSKAKEVAKEADVPVLEGEIINNLCEIDPLGIKYPVLIKAVAGGGGKGLRIVRDKTEFEGSFMAAKREAKQYFGNDGLIIEPYIENARHIEVQILGDQHGTITHLFERECSIQRNHQKIIEEAPALSLSAHLKGRIYDAAVRYAAQLNYSGVGTVEFLVSGDDFWFLEMNTRIQVEHAVTELITGVDIVKEQINIARNRPLSPEVLNAGIKGHAIEARIYAENPYENFQPSAGKIELFVQPEGGRFDTFLKQGAIITTHFDSLLSKLIVHAKNREKAIRELTWKLKELKIFGVLTNVDYLLQIINNRNYIANNVSTTFITDNRDSLFRNDDCTRNEFLLASFIYNRFINPVQSPGNLWQKAGTDVENRKLQVNIEGNQHYVRILHKEDSRHFCYLYNQKEVYVEILKETPQHVSVKINNEILQCYYTCAVGSTSDFYGYGSKAFRISSPNVLSMANQPINGQRQKNSNGFNQICSPLFGKVISVRVKPEDFVDKGDVLLTIESMKTENNILSGNRGVIKKILVEEGVQVSENTELVIMNTYD